MMPFNVRSKKAGIIAGLAALLLAGVAVVFMVGAQRGSQARGSFDDLESSQSPLGGMFDRMSRVSHLKEQMGELRGVWPAMSQFAQAHQGILPTNLVELRPYLPNNLARLSDERWEMPSGGLAASPLMERNDVVLLQQKNVSPNQPKIIVFGDGHIEYKK
jgi:hypothetical protein